MKKEYAENFCGSRRVPNGRSLPIYAWKLDNGTDIREDEVLIRVIKIHLENGSFNQIYSEVEGDEDKIKETVMEIVKQRGKMHNPYTGTGGLFAGIVEKIGERFENTAGINVGDEVIIPVSIAMLPLKLEKVIHVNYVYSHLDVEGYTVIYNGCPIVKRTPDVSWDLLLSAFEESASIKKASNLAEGKENLLVIGSNPIVTMLYGFALKKVMQSDGTLICVLYGDRIPYVYYEAEQKRNKLLYSVFDEVYFMGSKDTEDCIESVTENGQRLCDVIINCADQNGAEAISVVSAKEGGSVLFSNLTNNYTTALLIQEAINRDMNLFCAVGYVEGYYDYMLEFARDISADLDELGKTLTQIDQQAKVKMTAAFDAERDTSDVAHLLNSKSAAMKKINAEIEKAANYDCSVVLDGESGVGKEVVANLIHRMSGRKNGPLVKVNCAAIPKELMESEFFGYERGAFTGAKAEGKAGFFELADQGILLLDEVAEMPFEMQAKLLRVIQEGEFYRVGGQKPVKVNVRILASTNRDIAKMAREHVFREDLYYRLAVLTIHIPPLRERPEDIVALADSFVEKYGQKYGIPKQLTEEAKHCLLEYEWPGNVRELENTVQRLMIHSVGDMITSGAVLKEYNREHDSTSCAAYGEKRGFNEKVEAFEKSLIREALKKYPSTYKAAEALRMTQSQLMRKKKKYEL